MGSFPNFDPAQLAIEAPEAQWCRASELELGGS